MREENSQHLLHNASLGTDYTDFTDKAGRPCNPYLKNSNLTTAHLEALVR